MKLVCEQTSARIKKPPCYHSGLAQEIVLQAEVLKTNAA